MPKRDAQFGPFAKCSLVLLAICVLASLAGFIHPFALAKVWRGDLWAFGDNGWLLSFTYYENWPYRGTTGINIIRGEGIGTCAVPTIPVVLLLAIVPIGRATDLWSRKKRALAEKRKGLCGKCGYDLRASTDRCPECGRPVPPNVVRPPINLDAPT